MIMIFGTLGISIQLITRKKQEKEKSNILIWMQYASMILIVVLSAYSQYDSSINEKKYRVAQLKITALSTISPYYLPVLENVINIHNNFLAVHSYLSFEKAQKEYPKLPHSFKWDKNVSKSQLLQLETAKKSFQDIQHAAAEVIKVNLEYGGVVPNKSLLWASKTLEMTFSDTDIYFNPYFSGETSSKAASVEYAKNTREAFGHIFGEIRNASNVLAGE